jgi:hypothetical protein
MAALAGLLLSQRCEERLMSRYKVLIGATATAFALSVMPAWAQTPRGGGGSDRGGGGNRGGGAAASPRGGGGGGGAATNSGGSGDSSAGGSSSASGGSSFSSPAISAPSARSRSEYTAPQRPRSSGAARPRTSSDRGGSDRGGSSDRGRAVPRASGSTTDGSRGTTRTPSANAAPDNDRVRANPAARAVPTHARPRNGEPLTGAAVRRQSPPFHPGTDIIIGYYPYYGYGQYYFPGYGFGLGYSFYDPLFYDPYAYGYSGGSGGYGSGGYGYSRGGYRDTGSLRLKLKPRDAQVFVDGYYVGTVDEFDGMFQRLGIESGGHRIEVKADGYEPLQFEVLITPGETVTYKGEMKREQIQ